LKKALVEKGVRTDDWQRQASKDKYYFTLVDLVLSLPIPKLLKNAIK
jgi:hypothetical protein